MGLASGVFDPCLFSAVTLMVMVTTFIAPPLLKLLFPPVRREQKLPEPDFQQRLFRPVFVLRRYQEYVFRYSRTQSFFRVLSELM